MQIHSPTNLRGPVEYASFPQHPAIISPHVESAYVDRNSIERERGSNLNPHRLTHKSIRQFDSLSFDLGSVRLSSKLVSILLPCPTCLFLVLLPLPSQCRDVWGDIRRGNNSQNFARASGGGDI